MKILAWPATSNRELNPYNWLLYSHLEKLQVEVAEFSASSLLTKNFSIWHLHWPEHFLNSDNLLRASLKMPVLLNLMDWARMRGIKIVWTAHNLSAHENRHPKLEACFWDAFTNRLDACISLSESGVAALRQRFPRLKNLRIFVIPHGHYRDEYASQITREQARSLLAIPRGCRVLMFCGAIRPYKNVIELIRSFRKSFAENTLLYIVGRPGSNELEDSVRSEAGSDERIILHLSHIPTADIQIFLKAADLIVLPYRKVLNSGCALLALSFDRPILVPDQGVLHDLKTVVGSNWVRTYQDDINSAEIENALEWVRLTDRPKSPSLDNYEWPQIASQTLQAFESVLAAQSN